MSKNIIIIFALIIFGTVVVVYGVLGNSGQKQETINMDFKKLNTNQQNQNISPSPLANDIKELKIEDIKEGTGAAVKSGDTIKIHYLGTLTNGQKFDSSYDRNQPFETQIGVGNVIKGWDLGVIGMKVDGKRKLTIPPDMGYGAQAMGSIPANSTLIFDLELLEIK
ncbi:MAG: FKBP-type peptidyl-prolyl cis-trans isomerase [bacterium]|nr:FKBP-type peptidyl-prolyl cis-trans isomerase [bacterium]